MDIDGNVHDVVRSEPPKAAGHSCLPVAELVNSVQMTIIGSDESFCYRDLVVESGSVFLIHLARRSSALSSSSSSSAACSSNSPLTDLQNLKNQSLWPGMKADGSARAMRNL